MAEEQHSKLKPFLQALAIPAAGAATYFAARKGLFKTPEQKASKGILNWVMESPASIREMRSEAHNAKSLRERFDFASVYGDKDSIKYYTLKDVQGKKLPGATYIDVDPTKRETPKMIKNIKTEVEYNQKGSKDIAHTLQNKTNFGKLKGGNGAMIPTRSVTSVTHGRKFKNHKEFGAYLANQKQLMHFKPSGGYGSAGETHFNTEQLRRMQTDKGYAWRKDSKLKDFYAGHKDWVAQDFVRMPQHTYYSDEGLAEVKPLTERRVHLIVNKRGQVKSFGKSWDRSRYEVNQTPDKQTHYIVHPSAGAIAGGAAGAVGANTQSNKKDRIKNTIMGEASGAAIGSSATYFGGQFVRPQFMSYKGETQRAVQSLITKNPSKFKGKQFVLGADVARDTKGKLKIIEINDQSGFLHPDLVGHKGQVHDFYKAVTGRDTRFRAGQKAVAAGVGTSVALSAMETKKKLEKTSAAKDNNQDMLHKLISGAGAGAGATSIIYPLDNIADIQKAWHNSANARHAHIGKSFVATAKELYRTKGIKHGIYQGMGPKILKVAPAMALTFYLQGAISKGLNKTSEKKETTHPIARAIYALTPGKHMYDEAFIGRMNTGKGLLPHEEALAQRLGTLPNKDTYPTSRFLTNPITVGAGGTAVAAGMAKYRQKYYPWAKNWVNTHKSDPQAKNLVEFLKDSIGGSKRYKEIMSMTGKDILKGSLGAGAVAAGIALGARAVYPRAMEGHARLEAQGIREHNPSAYIRQKLRDDIVLSKTSSIVPGMPDNAVMYMHKKTIDDSNAQISHTINESTKKRHRMLATALDKTADMPEIPVQYLDDLAIWGSRLLKADEAVKQDAKPEEKKKMKKQAAQVQSQNYAQDATTQGASASASFTSKAAYDYGKRFLQSEATGLARGLKDPKNELSKVAEGIPMAAADDVVMGVARLFKPKQPKIQPNAINMNMDKAASIMSKLALSPGLLTRAGESAGKDVNTMLRKFLGKKPPLLAKREAQHRLFHNAASEQINKKLQSEIDKI